MAQALSLLDFPDELLISVLSHLTVDPRTLSALSRACKKMQGLIDPLLYASIIISRGSQIQNLAHALDARNERVRWIYSLDLLCRYAHTKGMSLMETLLPRLEYLKVLTIVSPWCNHPSASPAMWDEVVESYAHIFLNASLLADPQTRKLHQPLARLRSCTLHYSGSRTRYWPLDLATALFFHPTLHDLTISCATSYRKKFDVPIKAFQGSTPLRRLTLIECRISKAAMEVLLSLPKALQTLDVTIRRRMQGAYGIQNAPLASIIYYLSVYQPKLENFIYASELQAGFGAWVKDHKLDLSSLKNLKHLALPYYTGDLSQRLLPTITCLAPNERATSLETVMLGMRWDQYGPQSALSYHRRLGLHLPEYYPKLRTLVITFQILSTLFTPDVDINARRRGEYVEAVKNGLRNDFENSNVRTILQTTVSKGPWAFLFGKSAPRQVIVYDSGAEDHVIGQTQARPSTEWVNVHG